MATIKVGIERDNIEKEAGKEAAFEYHKLVKKELNKNSVLYEYIDRNVSAYLKSQAIKLKTA